ncbi:MAG: hypothetical protein KAT15_09760, partial [Bacteroidales bacterium]|nr:hypothetical protein [Bacteroidales bacterium]
MDQAKMNRIKRINLLYLIVILLLLISILWASLTEKTLVLALDTGFLVSTLAIFFFIPASRKPNLNSLLGLSLIGLMFLTGFHYDFGVEAALILAFYLLFPLAAVSVNGKNGIYIPIALGMTILVLNSIPQVQSFIHLDLYNALIFFSIYVLIIFLALFIEQSIRVLLTNLKKSKSQIEDQVVQKAEFISKLSHKLRTSLSNITLINNLVNDSRLTSEQKDLVETLKASTNNLIEDVNNIVEIASPGIIDYKKSIIAFDLTRVLEEAVGILRSGASYREEVTVERFDHLTHFLIGDPSLVRSLVVNIVKGLSIYNQTATQVILHMNNLKETPSQVRLEFRFTIQSDLGKDLGIYVEALK